MAIASLIRKVSPLRRTLVLAASVDALPAPRSPTMFEKINDDGHWSFVGRIGTEVVFHARAMLGEMNVGGHVAPLSPFCVVVADAYTEPAHRRCGIATSWLAALRRELSTQRWVIAEVAIDDHASLGFYLGAGFRRIGSIWELRGVGGGWTTPRVTRMLDEGERLRRIALRATLA